MRADLKERALEEFKLYWICVAYLFISLGSFILYRRLILADAGVQYLNYGIAAIESMIIAKVILIGRAMNIGTRFESRPLVLSVAYKTLTFGLVVLAFGILERIVTGLFHHKTWQEIVETFVSLGIYELMARVLMMMIAFIPMFAFWELGRVVGGDKLRLYFLGGIAERP